MATLTVGKGQQYSTIASAVGASRDGDVIAVNAGTYVDDFVTINTRITIQGVGGMVELVASHAPPNGKGIFVTNTDVTLDHLSFSGAAVPDGNGAGVRYQGGNLTILNSYFHDNENGLLANPSATGTITIKGSEFSHNGRGDGYTHNLYVGEIASLTIDRSYFHDAVVGHEIKSRAHATTITNSRITDGNDGTASYSIDLPNGGRAVLSGNVIGQGAKSGNPAIVHFGGEGSAYGDSSLQMTGNTVVNDLSSVSSRLVVNQTSVAVGVADTKVIGLSAVQIATGPANVSGTEMLSSRPSLDTSSPWSAGGAQAAPANPPATALPAPSGSSTTVGAGPDSLVLKVSEQAWNGDAQFTVKVDGKQVGDVFTARADHAAGVSDTFTLKGNWGAGAHKVEVNFVNDAWNGNLAEDRNLYLDGLTFNGKAVPSSVVPMLGGGAVQLDIAATAASASPAGSSTTVGGGPDSLVIKVSEQAWNGDAQFTVKVDGKQVGDIFTAKADHAAGVSDTFTLKGNWGDGAHKVEVNFVNDAWNGNLAEDRNLYLDGLTFNGKAVPSSVVPMLSGGAVQLDIAAKTAAATSTNAGNGKDALVIKVSEQAWNGDAQFTVKVDGKQVGDIFTAKADHAAGVSDTITLKGNWGDGAHKVEVDFVNDAWNGNLAEDRNLYVDGMSFNGIAVPAGSAEMKQGGAVLFAMPSVITGDAADNTLVGDSQANVLNGLAGNDRLQGGGGNDILIGGAGADILQGGAGADAFRFASPAEGGDTILDFVSREDFIEISVGGFGGGLSAATNLASAARFVSNTTGLSNAPAGTGQFIYETDAAKLWWDADGAGSGAATVIATFSPGTTLASGDIHLIG
ncbi:carbohydrate-binding domain-containing protein [Roseomonas haemaphysalidis]|nr:carbohydrate-binding domain-containing protein [Roseomonas haemaphysalidis]